MIHKACNAPRGEPPDELDTVLSTAAEELLAYVRATADPTTTLLTIMANSESDAADGTTGTQPQPARLRRRQHALDRDLGSATQTVTTHRAGWSGSWLPPIASVVAALCVLALGTFFLMVHAQPGPPSAAAPVPVSGSVAGSTHIDQLPHAALMKTSVLFLPNSEQFASGEDEVLMQLQPIISAWQSSQYFRRLTVVGHSARFGPARAAVLLSQDRAAKVAHLLRSHGVSDVTVVGVGFSHPLSPNPQAASNRVVVITASP